MNTREKTYKQNNEKQLGKRTGRPSATAETNRDSAVNNRRAANLEVSAKKNFLKNIIFDANSVIVVGNLDP
jgi:hypothetical protein